MCSLKMFKGVNTPLASKNEANLVACWIRNSRRTAKHSSDSYQAQVLYRRFGLEFMPVGQAGLFMYRCLSPTEFVCCVCVSVCCVLRVGCVCVIKCVSLPLCPYRTAACMQWRNQRDTINASVFSCRSTIGWMGANAILQARLDVLV